MREIGALLLTIGVITLSSCSKTDASSEPSAAVNATPIVPVAKVTRVDLHSDLVLTAEFEPFQEVDVMAKVSGYIKDIKVDIGDHVKEGALLATLEIPEMQDDLARAEAVLEEANADLLTARDELQRDQSARDIAHLSYTRILDVSKREPGLVPQQQVDEAHSRDVQAEAQASSAKSRIASAEQRIRVSQAEQARLKTLFRYAVITAPSTGLSADHSWVVTKRYADAGALIQAGTASQTQAMPVVRLSENGLLRLALPVPESAVQQVRLGEPVDVKVGAVGGIFAGCVARFADKVDQSTRTMKTEVDVPNPALLLIPGMYAEVDLTTAQHKNVLAVPVEAVDRAGNSTRVFTVDASGTVQIVPVTLGIESVHQVEILSGGLQEGDSVVVGSRSSLKAGGKVQPKLVSTAGNSTGDSAPLKH